MALNGMQSYVGIPGRKVSEPQPDNRREDEKKIDAAHAKKQGKPKMKKGKPSNFGKLMRPQSSLAQAQPSRSGNSDAEPEY